MKLVHCELRTCFLLNSIRTMTNEREEGKENDDIIKKNLGQLLCISIMAAANTTKGNVSLFLLYIIFPVTSILRERNKMRQFYYDYYYY